MLLLKCSVHPAYMGVHAPKVECGGCWELFEIRENLNNDAAWESTTFVMEEKES